MSSASRAALVGLVVVFAGGASLVRADALAPPPRDCPAGSVGRSSSRGTRCEWAPCSTDAECARAAMEGTYACASAPLAVCVRTTEHPEADVQAGPRLRHLDAETWQVALGPCDASGACPEASRCERARACAPPGYAPPVASATSASEAPPASEAPSGSSTEEPTASGGLCGIGRAGVTPSRVGLALGLAMMSLLRRRRSASP